MVDFPEPTGPINATRLAVDGYQAGMEAEHAAQAEQKPEHRPQKVRVRVFQGHGRGPLAQILEPARSTTN